MISYECCCTKWNRDVFRGYISKIEIQLLVTFSLMIIPHHLLLDFSGDYFYDNAGLVLMHRIIVPLLITVMTKMSLMNQGELKRDCNIVRWFWFLVKYCVRGYRKRVCWHTCPCRYSTTLSKGTNIICTTSRSGRRLACRFKTSYKFPPPANSIRSTTSFPCWKAASRRTMCLCFSWELSVTWKQTRGTHYSILIICSSCDCAEITKTT